MIEAVKAEIINIDEKFRDSILYAKKLYLEGKVFVYPTDTIFGFGANPFNEDAVKRINRIKGRDEHKRYIYLIGDLETLFQYVDLRSEKHFDFLLAIWPNPVSVILPLNTKTKNILKKETAAFRMPNHRFCLKLLAELKMPLISTSVNRTGKEPFLEQSLIIDEFSSEVDAIFYSDKKSFHEASTLIDLSNSTPTLIREGKIKFNDLLEKFK